MNKLMKFAMLGLTGLMLTSGAMLGCAGDGTNGGAPEGEPALPKAEYTIDESVLDEWPDANREEFHAANYPKKENSPLAGKTIYWLGSSVTYGAASGGESMADFLAAKTGAICKKEAVSGTTLFDDGKGLDTGERSYTRRLMHGTVFDVEEKVDAFICQISTNDARNDRLDKWGEIAPDEAKYCEDFDRSTTLGGVEFIIAYVRETWGCPVYFYSGGYFGDEGTRRSTNPTGTNYGKLVGEVQKIVEKWQAKGYDVDLIDLYNDEDFNAQVSDDYYLWCMNDAIHPTRAGYRNWWMPYFEQFLLCKELKK